MTAQHLRPKAGKRLKAVQSKVSPSRFLLFAPCRPFYKAQQVC